MPLEAWPQVGTGSATASPELQAKVKFRSRLDSAHKSALSAKWTWSVTTSSKLGKTSGPESVNVERSNGTVVMWQERQVVPPAEDLRNSPTTSLPRILCEFYNPAFYGYIFEDNGAKPDHMEIYSSSPEKGHLPMASVFGGHAVPIEVIALGMLDPTDLGNVRGDFKVTPLGYQWTGYSPGGRLKASYRSDGALTRVELRGLKTKSLVKVMKFGLSLNPTVPTELEIDEEPAHLVRRATLQDFKPSSGFSTIPAGLSVYDFRLLSPRSAGSYRSGALYRYNWSGAFPTLEQVRARGDSHRNAFNLDWAKIGIGAVFVGLLVGAGTSVVRAARNKTGKSNRLT